MTDTQTAYLPKRPLTVEQEDMIARYLQIIVTNGGYGTIELIVKDERIKFINLKEVLGRPTG